MVKDYLQLVNQVIQKFIPAPTETQKACNT